MNTTEFLDRMLDGFTVEDLIRARNGGPETAFIVGDKWVPVDEVVAFLNDRYDDGR